MFEQLDSVTKALYCGSITLSGVRLLFDAVTHEYPAARSRLDSPAQIVHHPDFEPAVRKIQVRKVELLTEEEKNCI